MKPEHMTQEDWNNEQEFFEKAGDQWLHPMQYGECFWPVTIEEMYQHFKARLKAVALECRVRHGAE